jgi:hypothetical protein
MAKKNADTNYNTNLASEYLMMSLLHRTGKDAYLSLGNKKGVDIIVKTKNGAFCEIEVKGTNGYTWPIGNDGIIRSEMNLFYALVCYNNKILNITNNPDFWLIHSSILCAPSEYSVAKNKKTVYISKKYIKDKYEDNKNNFCFLDDYLNNH